MESFVMIDFRNISIHSLRMEGDAIGTTGTTSPGNFNPLPPHGGRRVTILLPKSDVATFQSTPSAWRETTGAVSGYGAGKFQSTPSAWRETNKVYYSIFPRKFQSTPSAWRETVPKLLSAVLPFHFNPLPPHGGRRAFEAIRKQEQAISIHSLRMEGDVRAKLVSGWSLTFQSTPSAWRETPFPFRRYRDHGISIHSLRMEGDTDPDTGTVPVDHFNPLPPHGGRPNGK